MFRRSNTRHCVIEFVVESRALRDSGQAIALCRKPLRLLVPSHLATAVMDGSAVRVLVGGADCGLPRVLSLPSVEKDELTVLEFATAAGSHVVPVLIPTAPPVLQPGDFVTLLSSEPDREHLVSGTITSLKSEDGQEWLRANIQLKAGSSGSALFLKGKLCAVCQGMIPTPAATTGDASLIRLSRAALRDLALVTANRIGHSARRLRKYFAVGVGCIALGVAGMAVWNHYASTRTTTVVSPLASTAVETPTTSTPVVPPPALPAAETPTTIVPPPPPEPPVDTVDLWHNPEAGLQLTLMQPRLTLAERDVSTLEGRYLPAFLIGYRWLHGDLSSWARFAGSAPLSVAVSGEWRPLASLRIPLGVGVTLSSDLKRYLLVLPYVGVGIWARGDLGLFARIGFAQSAYVDPESSARLFYVVVSVGITLLL